MINARGKSSGYYYNVQDLAMFLCWCRRGWERVWKWASSRIMISDVRIANYEKRDHIWKLILQPKTSRCKIRVASHLLKLILDLQGRYLISSRKDQKGRQKDLNLSWYRYTERSCMSSGVEYCRYILRYEYVCKASHMRIKGMQYHMLEILLCSQSHWRVNLFLCLVMLYFCGRPSWCQAEGNP